MPVQWSRCSIKDRTPVSASVFCVRICIQPRNAHHLHIFRITLYWNQVSFQDHLVLDNSAKHANGERRKTRYHGSLESGAEMHPPGIVLR